jgi:hypothetical protein
MCLHLGFGFEVMPHFSVCVSFPIYPDFTIPVMC